MNKKTVIVGVVSLVLVIGVFIVTNQNSKPSEPAKMEQENAAMMQKDLSAGSGQDKIMADEQSSTRYVPYSKAVYDDSADKRRVLYFYASWCPTCRPADADFEKNSSKIPEDMVVIRVNYNDPETDQEEKDLAKKYGITYQHTFVQVDSAGTEITKWNGGQTDELLANIK